MPIVTMDDDLPDEYTFKIQYTYFSKTTTANYIFGNDQIEAKQYSSMRRDAKTY